VTRVKFEGFSMDARTRDMLLEARRICVAPLFITQGSYNKGGVVASAGTHDGGGVLDIRATTLSAAQRKEAVLDLRRVGFAAWLRTPQQSNWPYHIHAVAIGCPDLSSGAAFQVAEYKRGKNGLASRGADDGPRLYVNQTWETYTAARKKGEEIAKALAFEGWKRPEDTSGRPTMSYWSMVISGQQRSVSGAVAQYRHQACISLKALGYMPQDDPDTLFPEAWVRVEKAIHRAQPNAVPDEWSFEWFVDRCGYWPPDGSAASYGVSNDWPENARDR
jgi:hypothetical protein